MAIALRSVGTASEVNGTAPANLTPGLPAGWQPGDILILRVTETDESVIDVPEEWTIVHDFDDGEAVRAITAWLRADAETEAPVISRDGVFGSNPALARIEAWSGCIQTGNPIGDESLNASGSTTATVTATAITPPVPDCMIAMGVHTDGPSVTSAGYSGTNPSLVEAYETLAAGTGGATLAMAYGIRDAATSTGNRTATISAARGNIGTLIALLPAPPSTAGGIPVLDTFSSSGPLGAPNWTARPYVSGSTTATDPPVVSGGQLVSPDDDDLYYEAWWSAESFSGEHGVFVTLATDGRELFRLWICLSSPGIDGETDGYVLEFDYSGDVDSLHVYRVTNDGFVQLGATISQELDAGDGLGLTTDGETLTVWHLDASGSGEWASIATRDDSTYTSGYIGVGINRTSGDPGPGLDNFGGGEISSPVSGGVWVNQSGTGVSMALLQNVGGEAVQVPIHQAVA